MPKTMTECSSKFCRTNHACYKQENRPSDSEGVGWDITVSFIIDTIALLAISCICCCCRDPKKIDHNQLHLVT